MCVCVCFIINFFLSCCWPHAAACQVSFGAAQQVLMATFGGYAIAIGYFHGIHMVRDEAFPSGVLCGHAAGRPCHVPPPLKGIVIRWWR